MEQVLIAKADSRLTGHEISVVIFIRIRIFITLFKRVNTWNLTWVTPIQFTFSHLILIGSILILSHLHLGLQN